MKKITVVGNVGFSDDQTRKLKSLGSVNFVDNVTSAEDWLKSVKGSDVVCSDGDYLLENLPKLKNIFVTYPYIELGVFDSGVLKKNGVLVANTRSSNRESILEWVLFSTLALFRKFTNYVNVDGEVEFERTESLENKKVLIVGKGDIGSWIGSVYKTLGMKVAYFQRGDNLAEKSKGVDLVVNCLSTNTSSRNLLDAKFFTALPKGVYFISFVRHYTFDVDGLLKAIDSGVVAGAAIDCDPEPLFDTKNKFYRKLLNHKNVIVTPHVAAMTNKAKENAAEILLKNIEAYISGKPQNILVKK